LNSNFLFAYGSLKSGFRNSSILPKEFLLTTGVTLKKYEMYPCFNYTFPYLLESNREISKPVHGELYAVDNNLLDFLDNFEGVFQGLFQREKAKIALKDGSVVDAYMYIVANANSVLSDIDITPSPLCEWSKEHNDAGLLLDNYKENIHGI
jgi:gamma-glutamylcyclotransferase (GGCT)/AIG2-like uncharacterized protein YtfP